MSASSDPPATGPVVTIASGSAPMTVRVTARGTGTGPSAARRPLGGRFVAETVALTIATATNPTSKPERRRWSRHTRTGTLRTSERGDAGSAKPP